MKFIKIIPIVVWLISSITFAQKPTEVPKPSENPINLTNPADVIIYIVLPLCVILLVIVWRRKQKNKASDD